MVMVLPAAAVPVADPAVGVTDAVAGPAAGAGPPQAARNRAAASVRALACCVRMDGPPDGTGHSGLDGMVPAVDPLFLKAGPKSRPRPVVHSASRRGGCADACGHVIASASTSAGPSPTSSSWTPEAAPCRS